VVKQTLLCCKIAYFHVGKARVTFVVGFCVHNAHDVAIASDLARLIVYKRVASLNYMLRYSRDNNFPRPPKPQPGHFRQVLSRDNLSYLYLA